jgi:hypothetical protein
MITDGLGINLRESLALFVMLRGLRVLAQGASLLNGPEFDLLAFFQDSGRPRCRRAAGVRLFKFS